MADFFIKNASYLRFGIGIVCFRNNMSKQSNNVSYRRRCLATIAKNDSEVGADVTVDYRNGLPAVTVPLTAKGERCQFVLRPFTDTVGDFCQHIKNEDKSIETIHFYTPVGVRVSNSTSLAVLIRSSFQLKIDDKMYSVNVPDVGIDSSKYVENYDDIRRRVFELYNALNSPEEKGKEAKLVADKLQEVQTQLEPLEKLKEKLFVQSEKTTNRLMWLGLGLMGVQAGLLGRLTWYEYSWDIMEPVTYFVTYSAVMGGFAYYVVTRQQYEYPDARDRIMLNKFHKSARKVRFDFDKYNDLKNTCATLEAQLKRIRDAALLEQKSVRFTEASTATSTDATSTTKDAAK